MDSVVVDHPLYSVHRYDDGRDGITYDWWTDSDDSEDLFTTKEGAVQDIESRLGLNKNIVVLTRSEYDELLDYKFRYEGLDK